MADATISHYYAADHDRLDELFGRFQSSKQNDRAASRHVFAEFKAGLERHIAWEEGLLFPLFEAHTGLHAGGATAVMRDEHRQIEHFLALIDGKLQQAEGATDEDETGLLAILAAHNAKEEHILYPAIDQQLSAPERDGVFVQMGKG
jgi:iron-sulfur cluster repair protein YtfE (RIC family)